MARTPRRSRAPRYVLSHRIGTGPTSKRACPNISLVRFINHVPYPKISTTFRPCVWMHDLRLTLLPSP
jgi:hypothetical protein